MIPEFARVMRSIDQNLSTRELAEVLWLLRHASWSPDPAPTGGPDDVGPDGRPLPPPVGEAEAEPPPDLDPAPPPDRPDPVRPTDQEQPPLVASYPPPPPPVLDLVVDAGDVDYPAETIRSPTVPALRRALTLAGALRPLRAQTGAAGDRVLDEAATAHLSAELRTLVPVTGHSVEHRWDVVVVVDVSRSMTLLQETVRELIDTFVRAGVFRTVGVYHFDSDTEAARVCLSPGRLPGSPTAVSPSSIIDRAGRRIVFVVSDVLGRQWRDDTAMAVLRLWRRHGPVALLHPLPRRLWYRCGLTVRAESPGGPVDPAPEPEIPVLEVRPQSLHGWAEGLRSGRHDHPLTLRLTPGGSEQPPPASSPVEYFLTHSSSRAIRLARLFTAAPLVLPVMRMIQHRMVPESEDSDLAEVFLSGILQQITGLGAAEPEYDFVTGAREDLRRGLSRSDMLSVLSEVSTYVSGRLGSPLDFLALLTPGTVLEHPPDRSFAQVAYGVLRALGGQYADAAEKLLPFLPPADPAGGADPMVEPTDRPDGESSTTNPKPPTSVVPDVHRPSNEGPASVPSTNTPTRRVSVSLPAIWGSVPIRNPHFIGRESLLSDLRQQLSRGSDAAALVSSALYGMGGVGKTQLAVEYAHRFAGDYDLIWWIPADDPSFIRKSLNDLAVRLKVEHADDVNRSISAVLEALRLGQPYGRWLLIFDNADQPESVRDFLPGPSRGGHVLITSRNPNWTGLAAPIEVDIFARHESVELLQRRVPNEIVDRDFDRLAATLGDLPLALEQAASWQAETRMSVGAYLDLLDEHVQFLLSQGVPIGYKVPAAATFTVAYEKLANDRPAAAALLELLIFFGPEPITRRLLREGRHSGLPEVLQRTLASELELAQALRDLERHALARTDVAGRTVQVHRLIQTVLRYRMTDDQQQTMRHAVQEVLARYNPGDPDDPGNRERLLEIFPHVVPSGLLRSTSASARQAYIDQIRLHFVLGDLETGLSLARAAVDEWSGWEQLGPDALQTLEARHHLANALRGLGRYREAYNLNVETLRRLKEVHGDLHEQTIFTESTVGNDLRLLGELAQARRLDEENRERAERSFGPQHISVIRAVNAIAVDLRMLCRFTEARQLDEENLARAREHRGANHPVTLQIYSNLIRDLWGLGQYEEALRHQRSLMPLVELHLGASHPATLLGKRTISISMRKLGDSKGAVTLAEDTFSAYERRFGLMHESTLAAMMSFANALREDRQAERAGELSDQALDMYEQIFGSRHPVTLACRINVGAVLRARGQFAQAGDFDRETLEALRATLGEKHSYTLCVLSNLSIDYALSGHHEKARECSSEAYERSVTERGPDHPYTLACAVNYALDLRDTGERAQGDDLHRDTIARYQRVLGRAHPETIDANAGTRIESDVEPVPM